MNKGNLFYDYMTEKMRQHADLSKLEISYKKARYVLSRYNIPQWLWMPMIKEMMQERYITRKNHQTIFISLKSIDFNRVKKQFNAEKDLTEDGRLTLNDYKKNHRLKL